MGRARKKLTAEQMDQLEKLAGMLNINQIADLFGIDKVTFYNIMERDSKISQLYKKGRSKKIGIATKSLLQKVQEGNVAAIIFFLKTQGRWSENGNVDFDTIEAGNAVEAWHALDDVANVVFRGKYQITQFHRWLLATLTKFVIDYKLGQAPHLHISLPPQHGKSEAVRLAVAWAVSMCPDTRTAWASYNSSKAAQSTKTMRDWIQEHRPHLFTKKQKTTEKEWSMSNGSTVIGCGIDGQLTGEPVDLLVMDDLIKNYVDYCSKTNREKVRYWMKSVVQSRTNNRTAMLSIGTRWGQDDAIDILMEEVPEKWTVYAIPAIAGEDDILGRKPGEVLWPERHSQELLQRKMEAAGPIIKAAIYQQNPLQVAGLFFKRDQWKTWNQKRDEPMKRSIRCRYWDLAFTKGGHGTSGALGYLHESGRFPIEDIKVFRDEWPAAKREIINQALKDGPDVYVGIEGNGTQVGYYQELNAELEPKGFTVIRRKSKPDKEDDARAWQSAQWAGLVELGTVDNFIDRAERFPENDIDEVDSISGLHWMCRLYGKHLPAVEVF